MADVGRSVPAPVVWYERQYSGREEEESCPACDRVVSTAIRSSPYGLGQRVADFLPDTLGYVLNKRNPTTK